MPVCVDLWMETRPLIPRDRYLSRALISNIHSSPRFAPIHGWRTDRVCHFPRRGRPIRLGKYSPLLPSEQIVYPRYSLKILSAVADSACQCAFFQRTKPGRVLTAALAKQKVDDLLANGCQYCGSAPLEPSGNVMDGEFTINFVEEACDIPIYTASACPITHVS
ncbi:unnamed protein product [Periconia digitata]|uniref:Killer toxin Kp4 domain-containing protein n=1 Tax=Periconia digitata TaxID=1303443 RepID=A0A9W4UV73_9PLEO|nr:unnamed protein product [Periconia digitata]